jgi:hypothetical protein
MTTQGELIIDANKINKNCLNIQIDPENSFTRPRMEEISTRKKFKQRVLAKSTKFFKKKKYLFLIQHSEKKVTNIDIVQKD